MAGFNLHGGISYKSCNKKQRKEGMHLDDEFQNAHASDKPSAASMQVFIKSGEPENPAW